jgi:hypothetical protein
MYVEIVCTSEYKPLSYMEKYRHPPAARWFLARLIFNPEDGSDKFFRNVGVHKNYMALYPERLQLA